MPRRRSDNRNASAEPSARERAVHQLNRIEIGGAYVGFAGSEGGEAREERQATDYVAGVTRWKGWLDHLIRHFYRGNFDKMEPSLRQVLRIGVYDLLMLDTPPHAAVHEAVELAKRLVRPGAAGLVNGILRSVQRKKDRLPQPKTGNPAEDLAVRYSHPAWMVRRWLERYGREETEALLHWNNERPVYGLRINALKTSVDGFRALLDQHGVAWEPSPYLDDFVRVPGLQAILREGLVEQGLCAVQDESAGLVVRLLDPKPAETVVDACAAPGGKALYAAERMHNQGTVLAFDVHAGRLGMVEQAAREHGVTILRTEAVDARELPRRDDIPEADRVLVDAPCSGLGVLAKRADMRWNRSPEELAELVDLQDELLDAASELVRPGGLLVYSTCTIEPEENQERVQAFLQRNPDFRVEPAGKLLPASVVTDEGYLCTFPPRHNMDGAFGVRLRKAS